MARVRVVAHEDGVRELVNDNKEIRDLLYKTGMQVKAAAESTASIAEEGEGGRLTGYASAGFSVEWQNRSPKRPHVNIVSNADPNMALRVHFHTQKRDGVAHMRRALYSVTTRGGS